MSAASSRGQVSGRGDHAAAQRWLRAARWWLRCKLRRYPPEIYDTISPRPGPPATVERLRRRVESGDWGSPDA
jgi:hypothetical protein